MRDIVALLGAAALGGGYLYMERDKKSQEAIVSRAGTDLRRMELEVKYRAASKSADLNARGWPVTIDPTWFEGEAPDNPLVDNDRPWVEVAGTSQAELTNPPVRMTVDKSLASFWYNPYQGVVRARVPVMVNDEQATQLYNRINGTMMASIFSREIPPPSMAKKAIEQPTSNDAVNPTGAATQKVGEKKSSSFSLFKSGHKSNSKPKP